MIRDEIIVAVTLTPAALRLFPTYHQGCAPDHPGRAQVKLLLMPVLPWLFPDDAGRDPVDQGKAPFDSGRAQDDPRIGLKTRKNDYLVHNFYLI
jgi:hypothetical protein